MTKVLYVEDNEDNIYMLKNRLGRKGFTVLIATDGAQGVAMAASEQPELILMDLSLPVLDGWEATRQIKAAEKTRHIPVIALSAHAMTGDREKALAAGCDDFDTKPIELDRLIKKMQSVRAKRQVVMTNSNAALLVVDDNEDNRYTLTRRLNREGYQNLTTAKNGREALERMTAQPFDLVLLDVMMPDMNGYEVLEHVKANASLRDVPIIMISALDEIDSVIRCIELGAEDYLNKPFNPVLLRARVGALLEKKRLRDEVRRNLARLEEEMDAARALQLGMLPSQFPVCSSAQPMAVHALMQPAREVGGDLYDYFYAGDKTFCFLVGDVSGKGASAAMFMARTRSLVRMTVELWRAWRSDEVQPAELAEAVNRELCQNNDERMFVTLFLGLFDTADRNSFIHQCRPPAPSSAAYGRRRCTDRCKAWFAAGCPPATRNTRAAPWRYSPATQCLCVRTEFSRL